MGAIIATAVVAGMFVLMTLTGHNNGPMAPEELAFKLKISGIVTLGILIAAYVHSFRSSRAR